MDTRVWQDLMEAFHKNQLAVWNLPNKEYVYFINIYKLCDSHPLSQQILLYL